jgi:hypothetical protein
MKIEGNDQRLAAATAIQLQQTGVQQMLAAKNYQRQDANSASKENTIHSIASDKVSIKVELPQNTVDTLQKMGTISDFLNSVATNLRQTHDGLTSAAAIVTDMKASLQMVVKNYPPYPIEDRGRVEELMRYSSLQKEIDQLTIPRPVPPIYEKVQHLWEGLTNGTTIQTPAVPQDVPQSHIAAAVKQLDSIYDQIQLVKESMRNSAGVA